MNNYNLLAGHFINFNKFKIAHDLFIAKIVKPRSEKNNLSFEDSYKILTKCQSYDEYKLRFSIEGLNDEILYTEDQFQAIRDMYVNYFSILEK